MTDVDSGRWASAHSAEQRSWQLNVDWKEVPRETRAYEWGRHLKDVGLTLDDFKEQSVLDVGCGPTSILYFIDAERRVGIDPLADLYEQWNGHYGRPIELIESMAEAMPFNDAEFDTVFCINCIDHTKAPAAILAEIARVIKPGGRFVFHVDLDSPLRKLHKKVKKECGLAHPHSLRYGWVRERIEEHFTIVTEMQDPEVFRPSWATMRYEAYWDGVIYRLTKSERWRNHVWLLAIRN